MRRLRAEYAIMRHVLRRWAMSNLDADGVKAIEGMEDENEVGDEWSFQEDRKDLQDHLEEFRDGGELSGLPCPGHRHFESDSRARELYDGSIVGWTRWYGGGLSGEPWAVSWLEDAYYVTRRTEVRMVNVYTREEE